MKSESQESENIEAGKSSRPGNAEIESVNDNVNSESITPGVITYTAPVDLGFDTAYKTRLTGKLKVAEIVQGIFVVMVSRLVSNPGSYVDVFVSYLLGLGFAGICISGIIFFLNSSGIVDLYWKSYKTFWIGIEFTYCTLWLAQYLVVPTLILCFTYSVEYYDAFIYSGSYERHLIFMVVIAYFSTLVYIWDLWATYKMLKKQLKNSDASLMLNPTTALVS